MADLMAQIEALLRELLVTELEIPEKTALRCDPSTPLIGRGVGLDSMEALALVTGLEKAFNIQVPDEDLTIDLFRSLNHLVTYVSERINTRHQSRQ